MENLVNFWKDKRVLITGHTGFKGGWLSLWLQSLQATLLGFSLAPPTEPNLFTIAQVGDMMEDVRGDIRDLSHLKKVMQEFKPEIVFHLAAQPLVRHSYLDPIETYSTNVMGTVNICEAVRHTPSCLAFLNVTTDKCYENREWPWGYRETDPLGGNDPYSSSKSCSELISAAYRKSFFPPCEKGLATARAGNVLGGGDWAQDRLIPDVIAACLNDTPIEIRHPHSIRPWQHVLDPLCGYLQLAQNLYENPLQHAEPWNFGPNETDVKPVSWIVDQIIELWGTTIDTTTPQTPQPHEATFLKLDTSKTRSHLHWKPLIPIDTILQMTVEWYQAYYYANASMKAFTLNQIENYVMNRSSSKKHYHYV